MGVIWALCGCHLGVMWVLCGCHLGTPPPTSTPQISDPGTIGMTNDLPGLFTFMYVRYIMTSMK